MRDGQGQSVRPSEDIQRTVLGHPDGGFVGKQVPGAWTPPPPDAIRVESGRITCVDTRSESTEVTGVAGLLDAFVDLRADEQSSIERFLRKWGPPSTWGKFPTGIIWSFDRPVTDLMLWVRAARGMLAASLASRGQGSLGIDLDDAEADILNWAGEVLPLDVDPARIDYTVQLLRHGDISLFEGFDPERQAWMHVAGAGLHCWATIGRLTPRIRFDGHPDRPLVPVLEASTVEGALALQLMGALTHTRLALCSYCARIYLPKRIPKRTQRPACRREECQRARDTEGRRDRRHNE